MRKTLSVLILALLITTPVLAREAVRVELDNGLTIVAFENELNPTVTMRVYVKTGGVYEGRFQGAGISHFYEHLHGDATTGRSKAEIDTWDESLGGASNAYTSRTHTCYHQTTTTDSFDSLVELMAETLLRQDFNEEIIASQRGIILKEINMNNDEADTRNWYRFQHTIFGDSPASDPILGYPDLFRAVTEEDLREYYAERYTPDKMVVVVGGDLPLERMVDKVAAEFGDAAASGVPLPGVPRPEQLSAPRYAVEYTTFNEAYLSFGFRTVPLWAEDLYALDVLMNLLERGRSSRLYQALKEQRSLVSSFSVSSYTPTYDAGQFTISLAGEADRILEAYNTAYAEVLRLTEELVDEEELERVKNGFLADYVFAGEELTSQASRLGYDALLGDLEFSEGYIAGCRAVTAEELREAARRYFRPDNLYLAVNWPVEAGEFDLSLLADPERLELVESAPVAEVHGLEASLEGRGEVVPGQADTYFVYRERGPAEQLPLETDYSAVNDLARDYPPRYEIDLGGEGDVGELELFEFDNGLRLLVLEDSSVGSATVGALVGGGYAVEQPDEEGAFNFMMRALLKGTADYTAEELNLVLEQRGGFIGAGGYRDYGSVSAKVLARDLPLALELVSGVLLEPTFPVDKVENLRLNLLDELAAEADSPFTQAYREAKAAFFGEHPYAHHQSGNLESIDTLSRERLMEYHQQSVRPENVVLTVAGAVEADEVRELVAGLWDGIPKGYLGLELPGAPNFPARDGETALPTEREQTVLYWLWPGLELDDPRRFEQDLLDAVLSGIYLPNGRLHFALRGAGLVYAVHAFPLAGRVPAAFALYLGTEPGKVAEAREIVDRELERISTEPVPDDELERGKSMLTVSRYVYDLSTAAARLQQAAVNELLGVGYDFDSDYIDEIEELEADELMEFAAELFAQPHLYLRYGNE